MGLETGTYISDLNPANPTGTDPKSAGDDHIRLLKSAVKASFPNVSGAVTPTHVELNHMSGATAPIQAQINSEAATRLANDNAETLARMNADALLATIASPTFTGTVTIPAGANISGFAPLASPVLTGTPTAPTAAPGTNTNQIATMAALIQQGFSATLPAQAGHAGQFLTTDGANSSWLAAPNQIVRNAQTAAYTAVVGDRMGLIDCSGTWTLGFTAASLLGSGWACYVRNSGVGDITLDPNSSETIDGLTSFVMYPGAVRLIQCDGSVLRSIPLVGGTRLFTSTANYTWAPGIQSWAHDIIAGGSGGGGGARSTVRYNGGGGGAGERYKGTIAASEITAGATALVTVGAFGTGGAAAAADNNIGATGLAGGDSSIGSLRVATGGGKTGSNNATTEAHASGHQGGGKSIGGSPYYSAVGQTGGAPNSPGGGNQAEFGTEWGGPAGIAGNSGTTALVALLGGQVGGISGASLAAGASGAAASTIPGSAGNGGAGNLNGSTAGAGSNGTAGRVTITEII